MTLGKETHDFLLYGFKRVIGVEFSHELCEITRRNIAHVQQKKNSSLPIWIIESDAAKYVVQNEENVFYFFRPFDERTMERVLDNLIFSFQQKPRPLWLIFNNYVYHELFARQKLFVLHHELVYGGVKYVVFFTEDKRNQHRKGG